MTYNDLRVLNSRFLPVDKKNTMGRVIIALLALAASVPGDGPADGSGKAAVKPPAKPPVERRVLRVKLGTGQRYVATNTIEFKVKTAVTKGDVVHSSSEEVKRTERFVDKIVRSGQNGVLEVERVYLLAYTKERTSKSVRPEVRKSPLQGRTVLLSEKSRRRTVRLKDGGAIDALTRRTVGFELDWRDILPEKPVGPGDSWTPEVRALARRLAPHLNCGSRGSMKVRYESNAVRKGRPVAKFYVDWKVTGMRDRNLFTKVTLAGDLVFDLDLQRFVEIDLVGKIIVRGAIIGRGAPSIVKGNGPVYLKMSLKPAPAVEASADEDEDD